MKGNVYNSAFLDNPDSIQEENYKSKDQIQDLLEQADEIVNQGSWSPKMAMIDKSFAERNALAEGANLYNIV